MTEDMAAKFDFWVCDNCHRYYRAGAPRERVRIEQRTERIYGTDQVHRPVEELTICAECYMNALPKQNSLPSSR